MDFENCHLVRTAALHIPLTYGTLPHSPSVIFLFFSKLKNNDFFYQKSNRNIQKNVGAAPTVAVTRDIITYYSYRIDYIIDMYI